MPIVTEIQQRLRKTRDSSTNIALARAVREGVLLADDLYGEGNLLDSPLGYDIRGLVRRVGIAVQIHTFSTRGDLPFTTEIKPMPKGRWHWLEIQAPGLLAHVCRTVDVYSFPDEAESRQDVRLAIQPNLLSWSAKQKSLGEIVGEVPELYAWLTYGLAADGELCHLSWASPAPDENSWLAHISVLQEIRKAERAITETPPVPDPKERLRFKDHVQHFLAERHNKAEDE